MNFAHSLHVILVIRKHTAVFRGDFFSAGGKGEAATWQDLSMEEFFMGEENFSPKKA